MKNTVTMTLERYDQLKTDLYLKQEELRNARHEVQKMYDIRLALLDEHLDTYNMRHYTLDECTDFKSYRFGLERKENLFNLGYELQEMIEFIKARYKEFHEETEVTENE